MVTARKDNQTVKINEDLLKRAKAFVKANQIRYATVKQLINVAVLEFLERAEKGKNL